MAKTAALHLGGCWLMMTPVLHPVTAAVAATALLVQEVVLVAVALATRPRKFLLPC
jgi:hypothetical protein